MADAPGPTTVQLTAAQTPALLALKDGFDASWQALTAATSVSMTVHGPYSVLVVCDGPAGAQTWEYLGAPEDGTTVTAPCTAAPAARHMVTGTVVQPGAVYLADASQHSTASNWNFSLSVPSGTYDLVATTDTDTPETGGQIAIRRGISVTGDVAMPTAINLATEGQALTPVAFMLDVPLAATDTETLQAEVDLTTPTALSPAVIYQGDPATALVAPASILGSGDVQTVTVRAVSDGTARGLQSPFSAGATTTFSLPSGIDDPGWVIMNGVLSVALPLMPDLDIAKIIVAGTSDGTTPASYEIDVTTNYFNDTGLARPDIDTTAPGYQAGWSIDYSQAYTRSVVSQKTVDAGLEMSSNVQQVQASP